MAGNNDRADFRVTPLPVDIAVRGNDYGGLSPEESFVRRVLRALMDIRFALGYAKLDSVYTKTVLTTSTLLKEHVSNDDRILVFYNNDTTAGQNVIVSNDQSIASGIPIEPGKSWQVISVSNARFYGKSDGGASLEIRIYEYTKIRL